MYNYRPDSYDVVKSVFEQSFPTIIQELASVDNAMKSWRIVRVSWRNNVMDYTKL